ncbi:MAG TPA: hypothetical protein VJ020_10935, partial [Anaerolineales bacterium]|nr:hypothetical protein [Anaerolineales bacterium]
MNILNIIPFVSTFVTFSFAAAVFNRYKHRRGEHLFLWGIGLVLYGVGTFSEAYLAWRWSEVMLRVWYLSGAMLTAAWLGQGTVHLLIRRRSVASTLTALMIAISLVSIFSVFSARVDGSAFNSHIPISTQYKAMMERSSLTLVLTIFLNIYGTLWLIGGAMWSAYLFARKQVLPHRVVGNFLIAGGAFLPASAGTLIRLGLGDWLYLSEFLGAAIMFAGFVAATTPQPVSASR